MNVDPAELLANHLELPYLLFGNALLISLALLLRRRAVHLFVLFCLLLSLLDLVRICRFEDRWQQLDQQMHAVHSSGDKDRAVSIAKELLGIAQANCAPGSVRLTESFHHVGWLLADSRRFAEAEAYFNKSLPGYLKLDPAFPDDHSLVCSHGVGNEKALLGRVYQETNRAELAKKYYLEALEHYRKRCPGYPQYQTEMTNALSSLRR